MHIYSLHVAVDGMMSIELLTSLVRELVERGAAQSSAHCCAVETTTTNLDFTFEAELGIKEELRVEFGGLTEYILGSAMDFSGTFRVDVSD